MSGSGRVPCPRGRSMRDAWVTARRQPTSPREACSRLCTVACMCGRFVQSDSADRYAQHFDVQEITTESIQPSWNVAPTDNVYAIAEHRGVRQLGTFRWGLIPFWSDTPRNFQINARVETVATKRIFKDSFARRRCIIPADGFFEWTTVEGRKQPHFIHFPDRPLAMAGIWGRWTDKATGEQLTTCAVITGPPSDVVAPIHDRMPVILPPDLWDTWLDRDLDADPISRLLDGLSPAAVVEHEVSRSVNSVANNTPDNVLPVGPRA